MEEIIFIENFKKICDDAWQKGWHERNGGNISYRLNQEEVQAVSSYFHDDGEWIAIGTAVKNLANEVFLVTGSGKYIRNVSIALEDSCGFVVLDELGEHYKVLWGLSQARPTSEFASHLLSHSVKKEQNSAYRVIMHAHPTNVIALTFVLPLDEVIFTRELWEMATECPIVFPNGIGVLPWRVPGSVTIGIETSEQMRQHDVVVWAHHGMFCAGTSLDETFGLMDTVEKSADILVKVLAMGGKQQTITAADFKELAPAFKVELPERFLK